MFTILVPKNNKKTKQNILLFTLFYFQELGDKRKGAKLAGLAEQCIIVSGVGLAAESHGEKGRSAAFIYLFVFIYLKAQWIPDQSV